MLCGVVVLPELGGLLRSDHLCGRLQTVQPHKIPLPLSLPPFLLLLPIIRDQLNRHLPLLRALIPLQELRALTVLARRLAVRVIFGREIVGGWLWGTDLGF